MRFFNTAGPVNSLDHYCLPPLARFDLTEILSLIAQKKYFVLHAPRQTGKTTCLLALMEHLNAGEEYRCLYINVEAAQAAGEDVQQGMRAILNEISQSARCLLKDDFPQRNWLEILEVNGEYGALQALLARWAEQSLRPLILLIDEIDALIGDTLISVLRQLRAGYTHRPDFFPQSVILCGVRDVRDYRIHSRSDNTVITGGSPFNIKAASLRLKDFSQAEIQALSQQHTDETGQLFQLGVTDLIWDVTRGQPWLVNALAYEACFRMLAGRDRTQPITVTMIEQAKENLIQRRETHLDQLVDKLQEERVRQVIEPILAGEEESANIAPDNLAYVVDLGLVRIEGGVKIANRIYQEVIPRELAYITQVTISQETAWYVRPDGQLDMGKLLAAFQEFFREHSEHWVERFDYKEAGPQLLLQAFLQRITNGGGRIEREYGLGQMRTDLFLLWPYPGGEQKVVIELKIRHKSREATIERGLAQIAEYMDRCVAAEGHLVIFDRRGDIAWDEKIFREEQEVAGRRIAVWGM